MRKKNKQSGFALIEVMLAALVLTVGSVAFMTLQRIGLQHSFNDYARTQGIALSRDFVELLRSNNSFVRLPANLTSGSIVGGRIASNAPVCVASGNTCTESMLNYQRYLISRQMESTMVAGQSLLCYRNNGSGYMRITYLWVDNTSGNRNITLSQNSCPGDFTTSVGTTERDNSVTIYAQL
ncbi:MAG: type IV pilus modification protein PilV [Ostreibacterium sp.]